MKKYEILQNINGDWHVVYAHNKIMKIVIYLIRISAHTALFEYKIKMDGQVLD